MFANIVVGTDGSPTAREAVRQAAELAKASGATLHIVTGYQHPAVLEAMMSSPMGVGPPAGGLEALLRETAAAVLQSAANDASQAGVDAETYAIAGEPASAIIDVAETHRADLVVVGNRGMTGAKRFLLGSVPGKVVHHAPCTVLITRTS